ncbi:MAG: glycosyltransferase, partial [bacterium]|nr:glycosyltransferase [bacterium]
MTYTVSMGIMAYNEEAIIGSLLKTVLQQRRQHARLMEIVVVASGCTDKTEEIVRSYMQADGCVRLLVQPKREGKASAINLFLEDASGDIVILESADTIPDEGTLDKLIAPFSDPQVGMTGAHPIPIDPKEGFIGFMVHLLWTLHHKIALQRPKLGELVAFRNIIEEIPPDTAVDEASLEAIIQEKGYKLRYVADAIVRNKGPENLRDMI